MRNATRKMFGGGRWRRPCFETGATLAEFVIVAPIALLLVMGIIQMGLMMSAKQIVNEAAFVAARAGAVSNAQTGFTNPMQQALIRGLIPFYQDSTDTTAFTRIGLAFLRAQGDAALGYMSIEVLNPSSDAFSDFGLTDSQNHTYIPNDSLEYRDYTVKGAKSGLTIQDANALKIKVTYGYPLKVPLMQTVIKSIMCAYDSGVEAFGRGRNGRVGSISDCLRYYQQGRIPIVAYATVQMQTPAWQ